MWSWGTLPQAPGADHMPSAPHFWELNISPKMLSSTFIDEVGYLPIDQRGADLLFQVISQRYERGSIVITSNKAFKQWPTIFNGDSLPPPSLIAFFITPKRSSLKVPATG
jgi:IstB-like ATP binding protein